MLTIEFSDYTDQVIESWYDVSAGQIPNNGDFIRIKGKWYQVHGKRFWGTQNLVTIPVSSPELDIEFHRD